MIATVTTTPIRTKDCMIANPMSQVTTNDVVLDEVQPPFTQLEYQESIKLLTVHYLNVGSADCILVQNDGKNMLIDAGIDSTSKKVIDYLNSNNVEKIDILVATHFHIDHVGGMDDVVQNFDIGQVYLNYHKTNDTPYYNLMKAINVKNLTYIEPTIGTTFKFGDTNCIVLNPDGGEYNGGNNYSIVIKMVYGDNSFLFGGDAESGGEKRLLESGYDLKANVYKAGHHAIEGSNTTTYLKAVNPKYIVVSASKPYSTVMQRFESTGAKIYVTGQLGNIVVTSDKSNIIFK